MQGRGPCGLLAPPHPVSCKVLVLDLISEIFISHSVCEVVEEENCQVFVVEKIWQP